MYNKLKHVFKAIFGDHNYRKVPSFVHQSLNHLLMKEPKKLIKIILMIL